ncbi:hypothetical protein QQX98_011526 [Neonectria punicea]|uniref:AAA+ ATPase domain-containing protein n=1 Tax=Neonectria punicea TaxID=979145 RepID=A0ABR1GLJ3_9HYPO
MALQSPSAARVSKITSLFWAFVKGRQVNNSSDARQFFDACDVFCNHQTPMKCVEVIISNQNGLKALEAAVRAQLDPAFISSTALPFLKHLSDPGVEALNNARFLHRILLAILEPRSFWAALLDAYRNDRLNDVGLESFAWLCLQIVTIWDPKLDEHVVDVKTLMKDKSLINSQSHGVRKIAYRIEKLIKIFAPVTVAGNAASPGGRHDNDFEDFRNVAIYPTTDELLSTEEPFLQRLDDVFDKPMETRAQEYRDWLYRLLREDMLSELREDLQIAMGQKQGRWKPTSLAQLSLVSADLGPDQRVDPYTLEMACGSGIFPPNMTSPATMKKFLERSKVSSQRDRMGALCCGSDIVAFGSLARDPIMVSGKPPVVRIKFKDANGVKKALKALLGPKRNELKFYVVDTAMFAYEPILQRLKDMGEIPLETEIINPKEPSNESEVPKGLDAFLRTCITAFAEGREVQLPKAICPKKEIRLRGAQLESFINGLRQGLGLIQGPPGTGKSFIGALVVLVLLHFTDYRVLLLTYTNHATDQFLEDLMEIGVKSDSMVRLGAKFTAKTEPLLLKNCKGGGFRLTFEEKCIIDARKIEAAGNNQQLQSIASNLSNKKINLTDILEYLRYADEDSFFWDAFQVPSSDDGFQVLGPNNKALRAEDVLMHWLDGRPPNRLGVFVGFLDGAAASVWHIPRPVRAEFFAKWSQQVREEQIEEFVGLSERANELQVEINSIFAEQNRRILKSKRIIACTTTAAAMYQSIINTANCEVVLVEEAGEVVEAHIIAALSPSVKQLLLIGDHKQLRPKVNNYNLTKEKGNGYDLNVSLFERLVLQGHHFTTLQEQHRSHPEISCYARMLAYEELEDSPNTYDREMIRGLTNRVSFVNHEHHEEEMNGVGERWDTSAKASKRNQHEAQMVLRLVRYLGQQGYKSENIVVLTPYLGQLFLLKETLREENDPYLNDMDSHDLVRAGLLPEAAAKVSKKALHLSTIDNYQGEECDIVIVSLARSNASGDIGFLYARERLVVLMSRARNGMVLFGNMSTFMKSKKGGAMWTQYFDTLKDRNCLFDGVPVRCERHPDKSMLLAKPEDFDQYCPDGGCAEPCGTQLSCGKHSCNRHCHRLADHSKIVCKEPLSKTCPRGHKTKGMCGNAAAACRSCEKEDEETRRRVRRDLELEKKRCETEDKYRQELQDLEDEIDRQQRAMKYENEKNDQAKMIQAKKDHLKSLQETKARIDSAKAKQQSNASNQQSASSSTTAGTSSGPKVSSPHASKARDEWEYMKKKEGARNDALDKLMGMVGLESVKNRFLSIKSSVDTRVRQGLSLEEERFSCSLLGNPGTGKTTVARIWAKFLTTVGAIAGNAFIETTGSKLASGGVPGCEKQLETIKDAGGGVLFIDEAYQLSSGNNAGGAAVLDFILAEVENLRGKVIFVLAGYSKQMESFFAHNPGFPSRFPIEMKFEDYIDEELLSILELRIQRKYSGRMKIEDGSRGLYFRIASRRIGYSRGKEGFGNARAVENYEQAMLERQANRLRVQRRAGAEPDDLQLTQEDIIGPEPSSSLKNCKAYQELTSLIGLKEVKENLNVLLDTVKTNYERELAEEPIVAFSLNRVFLGSPGTGKTTVAKLFGRVLVDLGLLSNGEVVVKNPADFVGAYLGHSESQTKGILAATVGKVLVIDEAYGLYGGGSTTANPDSFKTAVIDTIVAEVQSVPGEDRCVLLLGYRDQMESMFQNVNPGLSRRFPLSSAFVFEDFDDQALGQILDLKLKKSGFRATDQGKKVALEVLRRARNRPNFGNAGEIDILLGKAKESHQKRSSAGKVKRRGTLEAFDFDAEFDRAEKGTDVQKLFEGEVGRDKLVALLEGYQKRVKNAKILDMDPEIPFNFLFRGPPGTGKTTTARKMGKVYYDMGFLAGTDVHECSATDLIGSYVGHTGPKVQALLDKALGRILFIDEAYRLAEGHFAKEAIDEIVDCVTKPKYHNKLIIILAGYEKDINSLLSINPGMTSRFPETVEFNPLGPKDCIGLLTSQLKQRKKKVEAKQKTFDMSFLESSHTPFIQGLEQKFRALSAQTGWANARDVIGLAKDIFNGLDFSSESVKLSEDLITKQLDRMFNERRDRIMNTKGSKRHDPAMSFADNFTTPPTEQTSTSTNTQQANNNKKDEPPEEPKADDPAPNRSVVRDAGVSDAVWDQLQEDKKKEQREEEECRKLQKAQEAARDADRERIVREVLAEEERRKQLEAQKAKLAQAEKEEVERKEAEYRKQLEAQRVAREADRERIARDVVAQEERRKQIQAQKAKLARAGRCPVGYAWIKQQGGYRCAGGSHWVPDSEVDRL